MYFKKFRRRNMFMETIIKSNYYFKNYKDSINEYYLLQNWTKVINSTKYIIMIIVISNYLLKIYLMSNMD